MGEETTNTEMLIHCEIFTPTVTLHRYIEKRGWVSYILEHKSKELILRNHEGKQVDVNLLFNAIDKLFTENVDEKSD